MSDYSSKKPTIGSAPTASRKDASAFGNVPEYTVAALSGAIKRSLEDEFGAVRVKGELGRVTRAASGHLYLDLKDDRAVISGVVWKGSAQRLKIDPEQGMEVVATGRISTFPGQSRYQLIIDSLEPAGVGALMALLEERKKKLDAEGLFDPTRKKPLPFLPEVIGVVTSPSGAVIRDILHRLRDRFPRHVIVWPTLVQGKGAENTIAAAIRGFNALGPGDDTPRPDVLIVARGGGSLEDLWCFNEEIVVRAAADSAIPLISAVGHETDTTLIDFAADQRAPTPTAAAEMAVPVRTELLAELMNKARRMLSGETRVLEAARSGLIAAGRGLGRPEDLAAVQTQRLDRASDRLSAQMRANLAAADMRLTRVSGRLGPQTLAAFMARRETRLEATGQRLAQSARLIVDGRRQRLDGRRVSAAAIQRLFADRSDALIRAANRLPVVAQDGLARKAERTAQIAQLLGALSHKSALARGFSLVHRADGRLMRSADDGGDGDTVRLVFADGARPAVLSSRVRGADVAKSGAAKPGPADKTDQRKTNAKKPVQKSLFDT